MRDLKVATKKAEVQNELDRWAKENNILHGGEQIVFSIRIEIGPAVISEKDESVDSLRNLSVRKFFTKERMLEAGAPESTAVRIGNAICNYTGGITMAEFLLRFETEADLLMIKNLGVATVPYAMKALQKIR